MMWVVGIFPQWQLLDGQYNNESSLQDSTENEMKIKK